MQPKKLKGKPDALEQLKKLTASQRKAIEAPGQDPAHHGSTGRQFHIGHRPRRQPEPPGQMTIRRPSQLLSRATASRWPMARAEAPDKREKEESNLLAGRGEE